jgi:hypothetical protein
MSFGRPSSTCQLAHLVLEQLAQRLQQLELHVLRQAAHIVMRLDHMRLAVLLPADSITSG